MRCADQFDVVIFGAGIAGCICAYLLKKRGRSVLVIEANSRTNTGFDFSETLPPNGLKALVTVFGERLKLQKKAICNQAISVWGAEAPMRKSFLADFPPYSMRINRGDLLSELREIVSKEGVDFCFEAKFNAEDLWRETPEKHWTVRLKDTAGDPKELATAMIVDSTGRSRAVVRKLTSVKHYDRLFATVASIDNPNGLTEIFCETLSIVEAVRDGWWYATDSLKTGVTLIRFTDHSGQSSRRPPSETSFSAQLSETNYLKQKLAIQDWKAISVNKQMSASTTRLKNFCGSGWMAIGDAAATLDPLSSSGISTAIHDAIRAADAISTRIPGKVASDVYRLEKHAAFEAYLDNRAKYYSAERRWTHDPFWQLRRA